MLIHWSPTQEGLAAPWLQEGPGRAIKVSLPAPAYSWRSPGHQGFSTSRPWQISPARIQEHSVHLCWWWPHSGGNNRQVWVQKVLQLPGSGHPPFIITQALSQVISVIIFCATFSHHFSIFPALPAARSQHPSLFCSIPTLCRMSAEWDVLWDHVCLPKPVASILFFSYP